MCRTVCSFIMERNTGWFYESMPGMGTGVSVIIPAEEGEES